MIVSEIELFSLLKTKLGEQEAKALVEFVEAKAESKLEEKKADFITVADKEKLLTKADALAIFATKEDLAREIGNTKVELIKWMVSLMIASLIAQISIMVALIKFMK